MLSEAEPSPTIPLQVPQYRQVANGSGFFRFCR
jgi:hypothetical protein